MACIKNVEYKAYYENIIFLLHCPTIGGYKHVEQRVTIYLKYLD